MRIDQIIEYHSIQRPGSLALVHDDTSLSFGEMNRMCNQIANGFSSLGVAKGDCIAVIS